ncbi:Heat shock protein DnaJ [Penicillium sp. DV-2018c]|nr:Heat shock protein DnaJ [Penicillium sp. DV-2018c]
MPPSRITAILLISHTTIPPKLPHHRITAQSPRPRIQLRPKTPKHHPFTTSTQARAREPNFYEILDVPQAASASEIKKQFYSLSMRHHPDRNRDDPNASQRFARISAAYNVLGDASKRSSYDREHGFNRPPPTHTHQNPRGSHSSYAGSRPASGLSKRRTPFHGPPPSFYEQGGYGGTGRRGQGFAAGTGAAGKNADPEDWEGFIRRNPLGHFNARGHFRTQAKEDARRRERRRREGKRSLDEEDGGSSGPVRDQSVARFFVTSGVLIVTLVVVNLWRSVPKEGEGRRQKKAGSSS